MSLITKPLLSAYRRRRWAEGTSPLIWLLAAAAISSLLLRLAPPTGAPATVLTTIVVLVLVVLAAAIVRLGAALFFPPRSAASAGARIIDHQAGLEDLLLTAVSLSPQAEDPFGWHRLIRERASHALDGVDLKRLVPLVVPWALWTALAFLVAVWMMPRVNLLQTSSNRIAMVAGAAESQPPGSQLGAVAAAEMSDGEEEESRTESSRRLRLGEDLKLTEIYLPQIEEGDEGTLSTETLEALPEILSGPAMGDEADDAGSPLKLLQLPSHPSLGDAFNELERRQIDSRQPSDPKDAASSDAQENDSQGSPSGEAGTSDEAQSSEASSAEGEPTNPQSEAADGQVPSDGAIPRQGAQGGDDPGTPNDGGESTLLGKASEDYLVTLEQALLREREEQDTDSKDRRWRSSREQDSELGLELARRGDWRGVDSNLEPFQVEPAWRSLLLNYFAPAGPREEDAEP